MADKAVTELLAVPYVNTQAHRQTDAERDRETGRRTDEETGADRVNRRTRRTRQRSVV